MKPTCLTRIRSVLASVVALYFGVVDLCAAAPNPKQWTSAGDLVAECKANTTKDITFRERGSLPAGTRLTPDNVYPKNYTTGDLVMSCKIRVAETKVMWREFESAPAAWNDQDRVFEVSQDDFLVQLSGGLAFMPTKVSVFRRAIPIPATANPKQSPSNPGISLKVTVTLVDAPKSERFVKRSQSLGAARAEELLHAEIASALSLMGVSSQSGSQHSVLPLSVNVQLSADSYTRYSPGNLGAPRLSGSASVMSSTRQQEWSTSGYSYILNSFIEQMSGIEMLERLARDFVRGYHGIFAKGFFGALRASGVEPKITNEFVTYIEAGRDIPPLQKLFEQSSDPSAFPLLLDALVRKAKYWKSEADAVESLRSRLDTKLSVDQRLHIVHALSELGDAHARPTLEKIASDDPSAEIRNAAKRVLGK